MTIERMKRTAVVIIGDFSLLASLYLAHFIVWRRLRVRFKERRARLKNLKLINGSGQAPIQTEELITVLTDEEEQKVAANKGFRHHA